MSTLNKRKWEGILSLVWACGGFLALKLVGFHSDSTALVFLVVFGVWWGVAMLLVALGLRSRPRFGALTGLAVAVLFIGFLLMMLFPKVGSYPAKIPAARIQISEFRTALDSFQVDNGFYPSGTNGLQDLIEQPKGATNWHGPYLESVPKDPWGRDYIYECPGKHTSAGYDCFSLGPPGASNLIGNWPAPGLRP